jgi:hypothetical protein
LESVPLKLDERSRSVPLKLDEKSHSVPLIENNFKSVILPYDANKPVNESENLSALASSLIEPKFETKRPPTPHFGKNGLF